MSRIFESDIEELVVELLTLQGYQYLGPEEQEMERKDLGKVLLEERLKKAVAVLNPGVPEDIRKQAIKQVVNLPTQNLMENNEAFHRLLTEGVDVEYLEEGNMRGGKVRLVDFDNIDNNEFLVCNQFTVIEKNVNKRPDVVLFVNGLPLVVIELKNAVDENATVQKALTQLQNYKNAITSLFYYNSILVASDGLDARAGTISADYSRFLAWKTQTGEYEDSATTPQVETLVKGMLNQKTLLDLVKQFTVYEKTRLEDPHTGQVSVTTVKKVAAYHQYFAVNKAITSTTNATGADGNRKAGVFWHTQGSGKSLSMVFYAGKVVLALNNPTIVVITDRNDLDNQLFDTFASCKQLLRQDPVQAESRTHLKKLLQTTGGGIVFTTIQKFFPDEGSTTFDLLSNRKNIIVMADEAHRSQYGFAAKTTETKKGVRVSYGHAKYIRDALPNASFIGFTGTPIEKEDASTPAVFGNYIDIYDIARAVEDGATVRIFYESRLSKIHLNEDEKATLDEEVEAIIEGEEYGASEKAKARWAQLEAIVGHPDRLKTVAADIVDHFEKRQEVLDGKAMIVCMSRRIAVELYDEIVKIKPEWHNPDKHEGRIKVVMTTSSSDPESWQPHSTTKEERRELAERFKNPADELKLVIVRDMWLTGFDAPCLHTMYIDKLMRGHNLMQAIARVNRVFKEKPGGLIVDYIGIASDLKFALATYTASGGKGAPTLDQNEAVALMLEKYEIVSQLFNGFDFKRYFKASTHQKLTIILEAQDFILNPENDIGKERFVKQVDTLSKAFALSIPHPKALEIKDEAGFFQAVKARLVKFEVIVDPAGGPRVDIETAIKQIVDRALVSEGVIDVFDAAGIKKPDISILSDEFLEEVRGMERKNLAIELLKKLLNDEINLRERKNLIEGKKLSDMLDQAIKKYQNNLITAAQVIEELIKLAKEIKNADKRGEELGLAEEELAFYDVLANNQSARDVLGSDILCDLARVLVQRVKANTSIDWTIRESVQAKLRVIVRRTLRQFGYPPDAQLLATENVLKQASLLADEWSNNG